MDDQKTAAKSMLQQPPTRREALLFGLLLLAVVWLLMNQYPTRVISVPDVTTSTTRFVESPSGPGSWLTGRSHRRA